METVITQHGLDINSLKLSRLPLAGGAQIGDSDKKNKDAPGSSSGAIDMPIDCGLDGTWNAASISKNKEDNYGSSSHSFGVSKESQKALVENDVPKQDAISSSGQTAGPCTSAIVEDTVHQRSITGTSTKMLKQDSEEPRSANLQEMNDATKLDKQMRQKDNKKVGVKRKKADSSTVVHADAEPQNLGILKDSLPQVSEKVLEAQWIASSGGADASSYVATGKIIEHGPGISHAVTSTFSMAQVFSFF